MPSMFPKVSRVQTRSKTWRAEVKQADPDYDKDRHRVIEYDYRDRGGGVFKGDPYKRGVLTPDS